MSAVAYDDRIFITGDTGSGKSTVARAIFLSAREPRLVIDPADSKLTDVPGAVTVSSVKAIPADAGTVRFVSPDPLNPKSYEGVYEWAFEHYPRFVWCDEIGLVMPANATPRASSRVLIQGRKRRVGHLSCHTRPVEVNRNVIAQAQHVLVFRTPDVRDREHLADSCGVPRPEFEQLHAALPDYGFLWRNRKTGATTVCQPLQVASGIT